MVRDRLRLVAGCLVLGTASPPNPAQVFTSEFFADPVSEGWTLSVEYCSPDSWNDDGWYHQELDLDACPPGPGGGRESFVRSLESFNGTEDFFP